MDTIGVGNTLQPGAPAELDTARRRGGAFTLIELLEVIAIIGSLATLLLPVLSRAKTRAQEDGRRNNLTHLEPAAMMRTHNHADSLPVNDHLAPQWHVPRVRSCSANCFVGGNGPSQNGVNGEQNGVAYKVFKKFTEFGNGLSASDCFVYLDENPLSLNDGWFLFYGNGITINDKPAINHGMQSSFSFADGHAEYQRWRDVFLNPALTPGYSGGNDTMWLAQHGTYLMQ
jgi:competence protein ComGC